MPQERRARIKNYIQKHGEATIAELAALTDGCSNMTLWRDLNKLEQEGCIRRTRGGAIYIHRIQPGEGLYSQREISNIEAKETIARAALEFVKPGHAVYFDAGSTSMAVAKILPDEHYSIITRSYHSGACLM